LTSDPTHRARRRIAGALLAAAAIAITGCSSSTTGSGKSPTPTASGTSLSSPSTATSDSAGALAKAQFVAQANAVCASTLTKVKGVSTPTSETDYAAIAEYTQQLIVLFPPYLQQVKALVAQSADKDELTTKWITPEEGDFTAEQPLLTELIAAADAKDAAKVKSIEQSLSDGPDHSDAIASFMTGYGLTDCASLETA
jgi:hypothetical protein